MILPFDDCFNNKNLDCHVELTEECLEIVHRDQSVLKVFADVDQWGTFYTFESSKFTVASEAGTRSFLGALIEVLEKLREETDMCINQEPKRPCPKCGENGEIFTSDSDWCPSCKHQWQGT